MDELADCARAALKEDGHTALGYGSAAGYEPLRTWIAARHDVDPARVLITNGSLQGFVFLVQHLAAVGAGAPRVLVEGPTYDRPLKILAALGADVEALPVDDDGLDVDTLAESLERGPRPALLYTIPTFQNPTGRTLSLDRRRRLAAVARDRGLLVLEDDPYGLVRFDGDPLPSLFELTGGEHVVYSSSFSKTVAPGLRVGWLVLPPRLASALEDVAVSTYITPVLPAQATVYEFLRRERLDENVARVCRLLGERRNAMLEALDRELPEGARWSRPAGGYVVWVDLPECESAAALLARADEAGVTFVKGADFFVGGDGGFSSLRLAYSFVTPEEIAEGVARIAALLPQLAHR